MVGASFCPFNFIASPLPAAWPSGSRGEREERCPPAPPLPSYGMFFGLMGCSPPRHTPGEQGGTQGAPRGKVGWSSGEGLLCTWPLVPSGVLSSTRRVSAECPFHLARPRRLPQASSAAPAAATHVFLRRREQPLPGSGWPVAAAGLGVLPASAQLGVGQEWRQGQDSQVGSEKAVAVVGRQAGRQAGWGDWGRELARAREGAAPLLPVTGAACWAPLFPITEPGRRRWNPGTCPATDQPCLCCCCGCRRFLEAPNPSGLLAGLPSSGPDPWKEGDWRGTEAQSKMSLRKNVNMSTT